MGISTIQSYCGAQIFEAVGLEPRARRAAASPAPPSRIDGVGLDVLAARGAGAARARLPPTARRASLLAGRRRLRVAARRRAPRLEPRDDRAAAARGAPRQTRDDLRAVRARSINEQSRATRRRCAACSQFRHATATPIPLEEVEPAAQIVKRFCDRRDELRLDLARGARDPGDRDEPPRRQVEHRRGRRGPGALQPRRQRRLAPLGDQAGRLRALRRHDRLPRQRRRAADQDGAGRQARRGRPAARPQGRHVHRARSATRPRASG